MHPMPSRPTSGMLRGHIQMDRERIIQIFFFGFLAIMAYELYALLAPFLMPIAWAILLAFMVHPAQLELSKYVKSRTWTALIITVAVATGVILPAIWLSERLVIETQNLYLQANAFVKNGGVNQINEWIQNPPYFGWLVRRFTGGGHFDLNTEVPKFFVQGAQGTSEYLLKNLTGVAKNVVTLVIDFTIVLMIFFYLLRDGQEYYQSVRELTPLHEDDKAAVYDTLTSTLSAVMRGLLLTALVQGVAVGIGLLVTGVPYWAFLALLSAACGLLPFGGTALVWGPAVLYLGYFSSWTPAIELAIWCVIWVAIIDNFIKPLAMSHGTGLSTIALFFGLAGGLELYGPIGIFAGPAIISVFVSLLQVYRETYAAEHKFPPRRASGGD
jgi:predicted PurR-regulated permease PerM